MPICLDPEQSFPIVLDSDKDKPAEQRPTFLVKALTMRQQTELSDAMDAALAHNTTEAIFESTCTLINQYLTGWQNMGSFEFGCDVREVLAHHEARELLRKILSNSHVQPEEKKS